MAIKLGIVAKGRLTSSQVTIYQTTSAQSGAFTVTFTNTATSGSAAKTDLWIKDGSDTSRKIISEMELDPGDTHSTCKYTLGPGDSFEAKSTGTLVDYVVEGLLRT